MQLNGKKVRKLRNESNLTQLDLSIEAELNTELISKIENGKRANTSLETAWKLAKVFNVKIEELI